jgi:nitrogen fixation/metabolism regulation signal transduction histidine kinase
MTTAPAPAAEAPKTGRHQRSIKNYMLDAPFQLKYTGFIVGGALIVAAVLGVFLWISNAELASQSNNVVEQSRKVTEESKKVSDMVKMTIKDDPIYSENPELLNTVAGASTEADQAVDQQQKNVEAHAASLIHQQKVMAWSLIGGLSLLVLFMGVMGIFVTHKIAGPIYKMKQLLGQVADGKLNFRGGLRKGDELVHFFLAFQAMVDKLKHRQQVEVSTIEAAIAEAKAKGASDDALAKLNALQQDMKRALEQ